MGKYAYVTLVTKENYIQGARNLWLSLKRAKCKYPLIVMATDNLFYDPDINLLERLQGIEVRIVSKKIFTNWGYEVSHEKLGDWKDTLNKFYLFEFTDYDYLFFLDADMLVRNNEIDMLLENAAGPIYGVYSGGDIFARGVNGEDQVRLIGANFFIVKPVKNLFYKLLEKNIQDKITNDEVLLSQLFPKFGDYKNLHLPHWSNYVYHDGWTTKYTKFWTWVHIDESWFLNLTNEQFEDFVKGLEAIGKGYHKYLYKQKLAGEEVFNTYEHKINKEEI